MAKIRSGLLICSAIIIILFSASAIFTFTLNRRSIDTTEKVRSETLPRARRLEEIAVSIAMIQRWLLDAALTGDSFGLDRADQVYGDIRQIITNLTKDSDESQTAELEQLLELIDEMYDAGLDMADAFGIGDEDEGYYLLEDFGAAAEEASEYIEDLRTAASDYVSLGTFEINVNLLFINRVSLITIAVSILLSSLFTFFSTSLISRSHRET